MHSDVLDELYAFILLTVPLSPEAGSYRMTQ